MDEAPPCPGPPLHPQTGTPSAAVWLDPRPWTSVQGAEGAQGVQGAQAAQGAQGAQGSQVAQGCSGCSGVLRGAQSAQVASREDSLVCA